MEGAGADAQQKSPSPPPGGGWSFFPRWNFVRVVFRREKTHKLKLFPPGFRREVARETGDLFPKKFARVNFFLGNSAFIRDFGHFFVILEGSEIPLCVFSLCVFSVPNQRVEEALRSEYDFSEMFDF